MIRPTPREVRAWGGLALAGAFYGRLRLPGLDAPTALAAWSPLTCPLRAWTGWSCPSCGLTRSVLATLAGDYEQALTLHRFGPALLTLGLTVALVALLFPHTLRPADSDPLRFLSALPRRRGS